jgi:dihydroflavonol-4-reductase
MAEKVLVTGITGFIAKHVALKLLQSGYEVRGTVRQLGRAQEVRESFRGHLKCEEVGHLMINEAHLEADDGWASAMAGVDAVIHMASPFPIEQPADAQVLIRPAVDGTLRVLRMAKAAGVRRVIVTSSVAAVMDSARPGLQDERHWCDPDSPRTSAYGKSKMLAERAAWDFAREHGIDLTVINPGLVFGPPLDAHYGASVGVVKRVLRGLDPMMPQMGLVLVDVRCVAEMHLRALQRPQTAGRRYIAAAGTMTLPDLARLLKQTYPKRRIPTMRAPYWVLWLWSLWDAQVQAIMPDLGTLPQVSNAAAVRDLGITFRPPAEAVKATADWLIKAGEV